jgi:predicted Zn-dependent protease
VGKLGFVVASGLALLALLASSCSSLVRLPTVPDYALERQVAEEIAPIIRVTADREHIADYRIYLANFPRKDILGMSVGARRIYVSYDLARAALRNDSAGARWLMRQILAHEVGHELSGHAKGATSAAAFDRAPKDVITAADLGLPAGVRFQNYSIDKELEADRVGMDYWQKLDWDCRIWVDILRRFESKNYSGDANHPTGERLRQAVNACPQANKTVAAAKPAAGKSSPTPISK